MIGLSVKLDDGSVAKILQHANGLYYVLDNTGKSRWINKNQVVSVADQYGRFTESPSEGTKEEDTSGQD